MPLLTMLTALAACGSRSGPRQDAALSGSGAAPATAAEPAMTAEPAEALTILDDLNRWCTGQSDECDVSERPDAYPGRVASGETNGWIASHREQLAALGVEAVWDVGRRRFVTQAEWDVRLMIGGMFAVDHLGPDVYDAIVRRAHAHAAVYLGVLVERVVGAAPDAGWLSSSYVPDAIARLGADAPDAAATAARRELPLFEAALQASTPPPADDEYRETRLRQRVDALRAMAAP